MQQANPPLTELINATLGNDEWLMDLDQLSGLRKFADNEEFQEKWHQVKRANKIRLANAVQRKMGIKISPDALFDVQGTALWLSLSIPSISDDFSS